MYSTWASSTFDHLLLISTGIASHANFLRDEALRTSAWEASTGTDLVVLTFQLLLDCETVIFFLFCFLSFLFSFSVLSYFSDVFFASLLSLTHSTPTSPTPYAPHKRGRPFCFAPDHSFDYSAFLAYAKSTGCFVVWNRLVPSRYLCVLGVREE